MTAATVDRSHWFKPPWLVVCGVLFLAAIVAFAASDSVRFVVSSLAAAVLYGNPSESDRHQLNIVVERIIAAHYFAHGAVSEPDRPPVFGTAGSKGLLTQPMTIQIYQVRDSAAQNQIVEAVRSLVLEQKLRPVDLCFMDHENWIVSGNVGERGPEEQLRRVRITQNAVREEGGQKTILYPVP